MDLLLAKKFTSKKNKHIPVLWAIRIRWDEIMATDCEISYKEKLDFDTWVDINVDPTELKQVLKMLWWDVEFSTKDNSLIVSWVKGSKEIKWYHKDDSVVIPWVEWKQFKLPLRILRDWLYAVHDAVEPKNFSPVLCGVHMYHDTWYLYFVGTDSFCLKEKKFETKNMEKTIEDLSWTLHIDHVKKLLEVFKKANDNDIVTITKSDYCLQFSFWKFEIVAMHIVWKFPDYRNESIMPTVINSSCKYKVDELKEWLNFCGKYVKINGGVMSSTLCEVEATYNIWCESFKDEIISYGVTAEKFIKWLKDRKEVIINVVGSEKPVTIISEEDDVIFIVRPLIS